ncbi:hypothetical protein V5F40_21655 [Xanthobacter sp. DSM 14520]|uniref:hypothetical protein n=1 Tax=Xanthobacter autotrophicus (strain ATCC BAA-1158 / Py2) TaxID=78245 RepID=UPI0037290A66
MIRIRVPADLLRLSRGVYLPAALLSISGPIALGELLPPPTSGLSLTFGLLCVLLVYYEHVLGSPPTREPIGRVEGNQDLVPSRVRHAWYDYDFVPSSVRHAWYDAEAIFWRHMPHDLADHARAELEAAQIKMRRALYGEDDRHDG